LYGEKPKILAASCGAAGRPMNQLAYTLFAMILAVLLMVALPGCGSQPAFEFDAHDSMPAQDELIEFPLGQYSIPIPLVRAFEFDRTAAKRNRLEFSFELYALVERDGETQLIKLWERHEGKVRSRVIQVCRSAKLEDLQEPELAKLKSHLADAVHAELGAKTIRRLLVSEVVTQKL
jgi:flagellar basal body-associated protein FliL